MTAIKRSAGVTQEVNLRSVMEERMQVSGPAHAVDYTRGWEPNMDPFKHVANSYSHLEPAN